MDELWRWRYINKDELKKVLFLWFGSGGFRSHDTEDSEKTKVTLNDLHGIDDALKSSQKWCSICFPV